MLSQDTEDIPQYLYQFTLKEKDAVDACVKNRFSESSNITFGFF